MTWTSQGAGDSGSGGAGPRGTDGCRPADGATGTGGGATVGGGGGAGGRGVTATGGGGTAAGRTGGGGRGAGLTGGGIGAGRAGGGAAEIVGADTARDAGWGWWPSTEVVVPFRVPAATGWPQLPQKRALGLSAAPQAAQTGVTGVGGGAATTG